MAADGAYDEACKGALPCAEQRDTADEKQASVASPTSRLSSRSAAIPRKSSRRWSQGLSRSSAPPPLPPQPSASSSLPLPARERCPIRTSRGLSWERAAGTRRAPSWRGSLMSIARGSRGMSMERVRLKERGLRGSSWRRRRCVPLCEPAKLADPDLSQPSFVLNTVLPNCNFGQVLEPSQPASTAGWIKALWANDVARLAATPPRPSLPPSSNLTNSHFTRMVR